MDLWKRRRGEWIRKIQDVPTPSISTSHTVSKSVGENKVEGASSAANEKNRKPGKERVEEKKPSFQTGKDRKFNKNKPGFKDEKDTSGKSAIQLAREKFAREKMEKERKKSGKGTGANGIMT